MSALFGIKRNFGRRPTLIGQGGGSSFALALSNTRRSWFAEAASGTKSAGVALQFVNDALAATHIGGHLPFDVALSAAQLAGGRGGFTITVAVDNTLHAGTVPPGDVRETKIGNASDIHLTPNFDFFPYAGILRPVVVQSLGRLHLSELRIETSKPSRRRPGCALVLQAAVFRSRLL